MKTTEQMKLGHRIQAYALSVFGGEEVASLPASLLGQIGNYDKAKTYLRAARVYLELTGGDTSQVAAFLERSLTKDN